MLLEQYINNITQTGDEYDELAIYINNFPVAYISSTNYIKSCKLYLSNPLLLSQVKQYKISTTKHAHTEFTIHKIYVEV